jgi:hypothetical protein
MKTDTWVRLTKSELAKAEALLVYPQKKLQVLRLRPPRG